CPLSSMLFDVYISNIFDNIDGVYVPGLANYSEPDKSVLIPIGTHSGKLFGMSESRIKPIQIISDKALIVIVGANRTRAMSRLREEFGIPSINLISDLIQHPYKSRSNTWLSGTLRWQKRYNHSIKQGATKIFIDARNVKNYRSIISYWPKTQHLQNSSN
ncbi:hypothetical protein BB561_006624, partial [Smittium simulii]